MKKLLIIALILSLTGCKSESEWNSISKEETSEIEQIYEPKTIIDNEYGQMNEQGTYELIYDSNLVLEVNNDYLVDRLTLEFNKPLQFTHYEGCHMSGEFRYSYAGNNYVIKLNEINIGFFYMGESGKDFFQIDVEGNQIRYWLYSKGKAELVINKIWVFIPSEVIINE